MINTILFALGAVMIVEGLAYVLAPHLLERVLKALAEVPIPTRRIMGALVLVSGLILIRFVA